MSIKKILIFGDELASGYASYLTNKGIDVTDGGVSGESISVSKDRAKDYSDYDVILIQTTTHDSQVSSIEKDYTELVEVMKENNSTATIIVTTSPGVVTNKTTYTDIDNADITKHNIEIYTVSTSESIRYFDFYEALGDQDKESSLYRKEDGLSLTESGYDIWHKYMKSIISTSSITVEDTGDSINNTEIVNLGGVGNYYLSSDYPTVAGRRLSALTMQPLHAYVKITIGDKILSSYLTTPNINKPNTIQNFEIDRLLGAGDTATFTIFDDNWEEIENIFSDNYMNIGIEYGYVDSDLVSSHYNMMLQNYSLSFNSTGVFLSVSAMSTGTLTNLNQMTLEELGKNPRNAVMKICNALGLVVESQNFDYTANSDIEFNMVNEYPIQYIMEYIIPNSQSTDGEDMMFYIDSNNKAYFKRYTFISDSSSESIKTFVYQKGYDSVVKDITFDIKGLFGGTTRYGIASGLHSAFIDPLTKEETSTSVNTADVTKIATGEYQSMSKDQSNPSVNPAGYSGSQVSSMITYYTKRDTTAQYEAQMTIIGDPTIKLLENIRIINVTDGGFLHHTSGIYMISSVIDSVDNGVMYTNLKLIRNASGSSEGGVNLINPKVLLK